MKEYFRKRPWMIIVTVKVLFVTWWISFVFYAARRTPADAPTTAELHGTR